MYHLNFRERANTENMHRYTDAHVRFCKDRQDRPGFSNNQPTHDIHFIKITMEHFQGGSLGSFRACMI